MTFYAICDDSTDFKYVEVWDKPPYTGNLILSMPLEFWRKHITIPIRKNRVTKVQIATLKNGVKIKKA